MTDETRADPDLPTGIPRKIGHYTVRRLIASGGMGTVYEAVQEQPRRTVAIKVMKHGVTSRTALRRFEYEAQLLARLSHPSIAQVYEAGTHDDGTGAGVVPFFAMEYIPNAKSITKYAEDKKLGTRERLDLFVQVCDAVHHGHQKGIIHRDLKPGNVLVDSHGTPKIIDFGVARATDSDMAMTTLQTNVGQIIGTVQYMSPEQCEADPHDIDTRSDVYSLGVLLYQLLCGRPPYDVRRVPVHEATRVIREEAPSGPSATNPTLRGDVETIVMKALEKDREQRYQSAFGFAQDIRRFLKGEAIDARPPSITYQLRIFARRNKTLLGATAAVFAVLVVGVIVSTALFVQAEGERIKAEEHGKKALAAINYLEDMFASADPFKVGQEVKIADLLDRYGAKVGEAFPDQPEVEAAVRTTIALTYHGVDLYEKRGTATRYKQAAREHLAAALDLRERILGEEHPDTIDSINTLAWVLEEQGKPGEAEPLRRRALDIRRRVLGNEHPDTLAATYDLADALRDQGLLDKAESLAAETLALRRNLLGEEDEDTLASMSQVAWLAQEQENMEKAESLFRKAWEVKQRTLEDDDRSTAYALGDLANALIVQGKQAEAEALYRDIPMPDDLGIEKWVQGEADSARGGTTVLVFFETWCPYSQREIPRLERLYESYEDGGLQMIGLVRLTESATEAKLYDYIEENELTFPIAKEDGEATSHFNPWGGIPSTTILKDGKMIWRSHPSRLTEKMLASLIGD